LPADIIVTRQSQQNSFHSKLIYIFFSFVCIVQAAGTVGHVRTFHYC